MKFQEWGEGSEIFMQGWIPLERLWEDLGEIVSKFIVQILKIHLFDVSH